MLALIIAMTLWGTLGAFVLWSHLPAIDVAFYRCLFGAVVVGGWLLKSKNYIRFERNISSIALAGICLVLNWFFLFKSFQVSTITIGNISYYLQPIILVVLGIVFYQEKVSFQKWGLISLALCGVVLTIDIDNLYSSNILLGVGLALLAAFLYSLVTILMKNVHLDYMKIIFVQLVIGVLILAPFVDYHKLSTTAMICITIIGVFHTLLAYFLYYRAINHCSFTQIATISYLDPIVAITTDAIFFHHNLSEFQLLGIVMTFVALYFMIRMSKNSIPI
jgi:drug/metabolite transporter (DMT)-like permease